MSCRNFTKFTKIFFVNLYFFVNLFYNNCFAELKHHISLTNIEAPILSESSQISLLTCSSGDMLYSVFGHSAIRVKDDSLRIDIVFNYGTFDFDTPFFTIKFMNGDLNYMLAYTTYDRFIRSYTYEKRSVTEGVINLNHTEKQLVWDYLVWNSQPENRSYRYDFFFDNCATRIRDIFFDIKNISIQPNGNKISSTTFRDYIHSHLPASTWTAQGIDFLLGAKTDRTANYYDRAFLPLYLDSLFVNYNVISLQKSVLKGSVKPYSNSDDMWFTPDLLGFLLVLFAIMFTILEYCKHKYIKFFDLFLFTICFLLSLLFWYLWLFTNHEVCSLNANVLWASILYFPIIICIVQNNFKNLTLVLSFLNILFLIAFFMLTILNVQDTPSLSIELSIALLIRNVALFCKCYKLKYA